jgi:lipoyl(octanoyl) transferase
LASGTVVYLVGAQPREYSPPETAALIDQVQLRFVPQVVVGGRKLVGSAQRTEGRVILQHGSVLVAGSQAVAEELLVGAAASETAIETSLTAAAAPAGWTTLASELGTPPDAARLAAVLGCGFEAVLGISLAPSQQSAFEMETTGRLRGVFSSDEWTWRR